MQKHIEAMREWCSGQEWDYLPIQAQTEIMAQMLRDEGFDAIVAGIREPQFLATFVYKLADMIEARYSAPEVFAAAGRSFAASACALLMQELEGYAKQEYEDVLAEYQSEHPKDVDAPAEAQARHRDYVAMVRS